MLVTGRCLNTGMYNESGIPSPFEIKGSREKLQEFVRLFKSTGFDGRMYQITNLSPTDIFDHVLKILC